jgi:hypothetical protein
MIIRAKTPTAAVDRAVAYAKGNGIAWETVGVLTGPAPASSVERLDSMEAPP